MQQQSLSASWAHKADVMLCYSCQQFAALQANGSGVGQQCYGNVQRLITLRF